MTNLRGTGVLGGQGKVGSRVRQLRKIPALVHEPKVPQTKQEMRRMLKAQKTLIDELLTERQERQIERQEESCRLIKCNLREMREARKNDVTRASHGRVSRRNSSKKKTPWINYQGKSKKSVQTGQQNHPRIPSPLPCWKCGYYHPNVKCVRIRVCYKCRKPGHIIKDCSEYGRDYQGTSCNGKLLCFKCQRPGHISVHCPLKAAKMGLQNSGQMMASLEEGAGESSEMIPDTIAL